MKQYQELSEDDKGALKELLAQAWENERRFNVRAFRGMLDRNKPLSSEQRKWLMDVRERILGIPQYVNLASTGKLARGKEVQSMVTGLALRPPHRRHELT